MSDLKRSRLSASFGLDRAPLARAPVLGLLLIWLLACVIASLGLGDLPLRDFDEGTVARVAWELTKRVGYDRLLPTLWDADYLNKPPGLHWLIAAVIERSGDFRAQLEVIPSEFTIRIVPALLSTLVVPLGGLIQWNISDRDRTASLATASILLTLMPIVRHGRLAMLDGTQLSAIALLWLLLVSIDRSPIDRFRALGAGLASSSMLLLKAPLLIPAALAAAIPMFWGNEFKCNWRGKTFVWLILGLIPGISWHVWNGFQRGQGALWLWWGDGAGRVLFDAGSGSDLGWRVPLIEVFEGGWPWLVLWPFAIAWAWRYRENRWAKWSLGSQLLLLMSILPLKTQLPWYSHPLWLPFALLCSQPLAWLIRFDKPINPPGERLLLIVPVFWQSLGLILVVLGLLGEFELIAWLAPYSPMALAAGIGWSIGGGLLRSSVIRRRLWGAISLVFGSVVTLAVLMNSSLWLWELNEHWSVIPTAKLVTRSEASSLAIDAPFERPSLNWYAGQRIRTLESFPDATSILIRDEKLVQNLTSSSRCQLVDQESGWHLLECNS